MTYVFCSSAFLLLCPAVLLAGGGLVLEKDKCILRIDFYSAHFTAYQPASSGNRQFCREIPATGETLFVLDYLHRSLKEVPVDFRIVRDYTGQGRFVKLKHLGTLDDMEQHTVFYQPPIVRPDASLTVEYDFTEAGDYIAIVSAGHPSNDQTYTAVFPFSVGVARPAWVALAIAGLFVIAVLAALWRRRSATRADRQVAAA